MCNEELLPKINMQSTDLRRLEREYTLSQISWKRSYTELEMKRKRRAESEKVRMKINVIDRMAESSLRFELENFHLFGSLRKVEPEIHNTLPSNETVCAEKDYISFEKVRKMRPHAVKYNDFYGCIKDEAGKPRTPASSLGSRSCQSTPAGPFKHSKSLPALKPSTAGSLSSKPSTPGHLSTGNLSKPSSPMTSHPVSPVTGKYRVHSFTPNRGKLFSLEDRR